jgi:ketosteroid isomerase-like protein
MRNSFSEYRKWSLAVVMALGMTQLVKADDDTATVKAELDQFFQNAGDVINNTGSAKALADVFYDDDLNIIGEPDKHMYTNLQSYMGPLQGYLDSRACELKVVGTPRHSGNLAVAFVKEHCGQYKTVPPADYRVMYVLRKGPKGWRVTMELWQHGTF